MNPRLSPSKRTDHRKQRSRQIEAESHDGMGQLDAQPCGRGLRRMREESVTLLVTLLDVRADAEYAVGHVPGALNIPLLAGFGLAISLLQSAGSKAGL